MRDVDAGWTVVDDDLFMFEAGGVCEPVVVEYGTGSAVCYRSAYGLWADLESAKYAALRESKELLEKALLAVQDALYEYPTAFEPQVVTDEVRREIIAIDEAGA